MKIGIMTFHASPNHGAALQAYALQTHLRKMGHKPFFINYHYGDQFKKGLLGWLGRTPANTIDKFDQQLRKKPFVDFQSQFLNISQAHFYNLNELKNAPPKADAYVCGSDQVWNPSLYNEKDEHAFWLDFGGDDVRRVSYAPSFGNDALSDEMCQRYASFASRFYAVSVREKSGLRILAKLGRKDVVLVPDPTLLLDPNEYFQPWRQQHHAKKPYLFSYQLRIRQSPESPAEKINMAVSSALDLGVYESYSINFFYNILHRRYLNPVQWLYRLSNSDFIVTNSFHATVFALLFHRPFITILRRGISEGMNSRIESLLGLVELGHRSVHDYDSSKIAQLCIETIDWEATDIKIAELRQVGQQFLLDALS